MPLASQYAGLYPAVSGQSGQGLEEVVTPTSPGPNGNSQSTAVAIPTSAAHAHQGEDTWYRVRVRFPSCCFHPAPGDWNWTLEWHNDSHTQSYGFVSPVLGIYTDSAGGAPRFHFRPWGGVGRTPTIEHWYGTADSLQTDHWYDLVFHVVWDTRASNAGGTGLYEFWVDGQPFAGHLGCSACAPTWSNPHPFPTLTLNPDGTTSSQTNALYNYRQAVWQGVSSSRVDYDEWLIGPSASSVGFVP